MVELVGTEYPMPDDDLPRPSGARGNPFEGLPEPAGPPPGSPAAPLAGSPAVPGAASGNALETAWRRWREAVAAVHEGLAARAASDDLAPWEMQELFEAERSARRVCAAVLRVAGHHVPDYLTDSATLSPQWPEPERPGSR